MPGGRKRKPTAQKKLEGTMRPDRANPNEPAPAPVRPQSPEALSGSERAYFDLIVARLAAEKRASSSHTETIALLAQRFVEIDDTTLIIQRDGRIYESVNEDTGTVMIRAHPACALKSEAMRHAQSLLSELGLTPASLSKVSAIPTAPAGNAFLALVK